MLVADDEQEVRTVLVRALTRLGCRADEAGSGHQALEMLERTPYDLLLLDIRMPGMDGTEVMHRARQMRPDLHIIILTAYASLESAIAAVKSGAADYLLKPISLREVAAAVASVLQQRAEEVHRQHLIDMMGQILNELRSTKAPRELPPIPPPGGFLRAGPVVLDVERSLMTVVGNDGAGGVNTPLTASEAALLAYLMERPGTLLSCRELARSALGYDVTGRESQGIVRPHISRLRKKIEPDPAHPRLILTVRGKGYLFAL